MVVKGNPNRQKNPDPDKYFGAGEPYCLLVAILVQNKVIVNPDKFQAIVLNKKRPNITNTKFYVDKSSDSIGFIHRAE